MQERLFQMVAERSGMQLAAIERTTTFEDLNLDSLDVVDLLAAVEDEFGIDAIPDRIAASFDTVGDVLAHLETVIA